MRTKRSSTLFATALLAAFFFVFGVSAQTPAKGKDVDLEIFKNDRVAVKQIYTQLAEYMSAATPDVDISVSNVQTLLPREFDTVYWLDIVTMGAENRLHLIPQRITLDDQERVLYRGSWTTDLDAVDPPQAIGMKVSDVIAQAAAEVGGFPEASAVTAVTSFRVKIVLEDRKVEYNAALLWASLDDGEDVVQVVDLVTSNVESVLYQTSPALTREDLAGLPEASQQSILTGEVADGEIIKLSPEAFELLRDADGNLDMGLIDSLPPDLYEIEYKGDVDPADRGHEKAPGDPGGGEYCCRTTPQTVQLTNASLTANNAHITGSHTVGLRANLVCTCTPDCFQAASISFVTVRCSDTGIPLNAVHVPTFNSSSMSGTSQNGYGSPAAAAGGYGCYVNSCLFGACSFTVSVTWNGNLYQIQLTPSGGNVQASHTWTANVTCPRCLRRPAGACE